MAKRKRSSVAAATPTADEPPSSDRSKMRRTDVPLPPKTSNPARRQSARGGTAATTDPNLNLDIIDGVTARLASPDGHESTGSASHLTPPAVNGSTTTKTPSTGTGGEVVSNVPSARLDTSAPTTKSKKTKAAMQHVTESNIGAVNSAKKNVTGPAAVGGDPADPEAAEGLDEEVEDEAEVRQALSRPPPVNSEYLPLPWKGRLGYVRCLQSSCTLT